MVRIMFKNALNSFFSFWFPRFAPENVALFRIFVGLTLWMAAVLQAPYINLLFTDRGMISAATQQAFYDDLRVRLLFYWFPVDPSAVAIYFYTYLAVLTLFTVGGGRILALAVFIGNYTLGVRNPLVMTNFDYLKSAWLLYLIFMDSSRAYSIWNRLPRRPMPMWSRDMTAFGTRAVQIQLALVYFNSGLDKIKSGGVNRWLQGTALDSYWGNSMLSRYDWYSFRFLTSVPVIPPVLTYFTWLFLLFFPAAVSSARTRRWALFGGAIYHVVICSPIELFFFNLMAMSAYILFREKTISSESP